MKKRILIIGLVAMLLVAVFAVIGTAKGNNLFRQHLVNMDTGEVTVVYEEGRKYAPDQKPGPEAIELPIDIF